MKKIAPAIAGILLGLLFLMVSVMFFFHLGPKMEAPVPGSANEAFMTAFGPTGYMTLVKVCELAGGLLVMIPLTRNLGLLILGPIIVNILAYTLFVSGAGAKGLANPIVIGIVVLPLYLLWVERKAFAGLVQRVR